MNRGGRHMLRHLSGEVTRLRNRLVRARHFRGHGVHSPFVYSLVREVFMLRGVPGGDRAFYEMLRSAGLSARRAGELQHLLLHCGYATFGVNCADEVDLSVLTPDLPVRETLEIVRDAQERGTTVCLTGPYWDRERIALCRRITEEHPSTSVDNRGYLLLFNNHLPKQHYCL